MIFADRHEAGKLLAERLSPLKERTDVTVLCLPRGGLPVGFEIARALQAPLDVFGVRKVGVPGHEELAMGAIASGGITVMNKDVMHMMRIDEATFNAAAHHQVAELERRERSYRGDGPRLSFHERVLVLVDDGIATGATMQAALKALAAFKPKATVVAAPVAAMSVAASLAKVADSVVVLEAPSDFGSVGSWYQSFPQLDDTQVLDLIRRSKATLRGTDRS